MVDVLKVNLDTQNFNNVQTGYVNKDDADKSIFDSVGENSSDALQAKLDDVKANNGLILKGWDNFKNFCGLGVSSNDCDDAIEQYKAGKITYEEAEAKIDTYKAKQDSSLNLFSNIATGTAAIVAGTAVAATGGLAAPLVAGIATGAAAGAVTKAGVKTTDRATNDLKGDALDGKQIAKDVLSGAVSGAVAVATAGTGGGAFTDGFKLGGKTLISGGTKACMANSAKIGIKTGALSGATNNLIECAVEEDKQFNARELVQETVASAIIGGTVGIIMGGYNGTLRTHNLLQSGGDVLSANTTRDVVANTVCSAEYKVVNNAVKSIAA